MTEEKKILVLSRKPDDAKKELEPYISPDSLRIYGDLQELLDVSLAESLGVYLPGFEAQLYLGHTAQITTVFDSLPVGVAVLDMEHHILWGNRRFNEWCCDFNEDHSEPFRHSIVGKPFYSALGKTTLFGPDYCPFHTVAQTLKTVQTTFRNAHNEYYQMDVVPLLEPSRNVKRLLVTLQNVTESQITQQRLDALMKAGLELADLTSDQLKYLSPEERISYLKSNIIRNTDELLNYKDIEIRLVSEETGELELLLAIGMRDDAVNRKLYPQPEKNGITGYVAYTGKSYLCEDTSEDPFYIEGATGAKSSLTVPLIHHEMVIGTFNVESLEPRAFSEKDMRFLESFARNVAAAINTFDLLNAEKAEAAASSVEAIHRAVALPIDSILNDVVQVLSRYTDADSESLECLRRIQAKARGVKSVIHKVGAQLSPGQAHPFPPKDRHPLLKNSNVLVVDTDESVLIAANEMLTRFGCNVESATSATAALLMIQDTHYDAIISDIRLPDCNGYRFLLKLRDVMDVNPPLILMTGFGYDPGHVIVNTRREGIDTFLYKPFLLDKLLENLEKVIGRSRA